MKHEVEQSLQSFTPEPNGSGATAVFHFAADLEVFAGHFPGMPIVPGVYFIEAARLLTEKLRAKPLRIAAVNQARFTAELAPAQDLTATIRVQDKEGRLVCDASFHRDETATAKMRVTLED